MDKQAILHIGGRVMVKEADALYAIASSLGNSGFYEAVNLIHASTGHVIILGVGKSGHVGRKICSSLSSIGTPSFFIHPVEAKHGDLGMITADDIILLISYSGRTEEIMQLVPILHERGVPIIAITGNRLSPLAESVDITIAFDIKGEACSYDIVPTVSASATLAIGDAMAIALMELRGFSAQDFSKNHPAGHLGALLAAR
ncbi:KpsF/GutQ family sugar-phosphate isomerase [Sodalis sp. RH24]|uniref:KpsF/GutQ family sugar-phosphate isomerase n=1 Tax=unclassified Sodalis (in: enterobacteria) TaxID=2636512 RepID=UPI0039B4078F